MSEELGEREKEVLRAVVQEYISTGGPVGSQQLSRKPEFEVSSATMRNVLADLEGLPNAEIGERLSISEKTVRNHVTNVFDKLGVWTRAQAIVFARDRRFNQN